MDKIFPGLLLGFLIGAGCRFFGIPLPGPPKLVGALVIVSLTTGYLATDYLIAHQVRVLGIPARPAMTEPYWAGPTGLPPSRKLIGDDSRGFCGTPKEMSDDYVAFMRSQFTPLTVSADASEEKRR
jgi:XapX domain-containing protein